MPIISPKFGDTFIYNTSKLSVDDKERIMHEVNYSPIPGERNAWVGRGGMTSSHTLNRPSDTVSWLITSSDDHDADDLRVLKELAGKYQIPMVSFAEDPPELKYAGLWEILPKALFKARSFEEFLRSIQGQIDEYGPQLFIGENEKGELVGMEVSPVLPFEEEDEEEKQETVANPYAPDFKQFIRQIFNIFETEVDANKTTPRRIYSGEFGMPYVTSYDPLLTKDQVSEYESLLRQCREIICSVNLDGNPDEEIAKIKAHCEAMGFQLQITEHEDFERFLVEGNPTGRTGMDPDTGKVRIRMNIPASKGNKLHWFLRTFSHELTHALFLQGPHREAWGTRQLNDKRGVKLYHEIRRLINDVDKDMHDHAPYLSDKYFDMLRAFPELLISILNLEELDKLTLQAVRTALLEESFAYTISASTLELMGQPQQSLSVNTGGPEDLSRKSRLFSAAQTALADMQVQGDLDDTLKNILEGH